MRQPASLLLKTIPAILIAMLSVTDSRAQSSKIEWAKDTMSKADAIGAKSTYVNTIKGSGQKNATERINLPVDKLKEIMDACAAKNVTEVSVMIVSIRQNDIARYRRNHPESTATDDQLKGSQLLVFKIPRRVFAGAMGAKTNLSNNPLMVSLMASGLILLESPFAELPAGTEALYFSFGGICPPPTSCDTD